MADDLLTIEDIELWTRIGVPAAERQKEQRVLISVSFPVDAKATAKRDDLKGTINYSDVTRDIRTLAKKERKTVERLAEDIARMILRMYKPKNVTVTVRKFPLPGVREVAVTICR